MMAQRRNHHLLARLCAWSLLPLLPGCGGSSERQRAHAPTPRAASEPAAQKLEVMPPMNVLQRLRGGEAERRECFAASGGDNDGFVKLAWRVAPDGKAQGIVVQGSSVHHAGIERCLAEAVARLDFGPRQEPAVARWTFIHRLPKMPDRREVPKQRRKGRKRSNSDREIAGVSIEESSPGSLELQRIEDIVHAGFPLFAYCYRAGLERDPSLSGVVRLRFVIDDEGAVMGVMDSGSEFADRSALDCMAEGIFALSFPAPVGGDVRVQYRIVFESG